MKEIWKKLDAWEGDRYISNYGRVKSLGNRTNNKKITYGSENNQGYMRIGLTKMEKLQANKYIGL